MSHRLHATNVSRIQCDRISSPLLLCRHTFSSPMRIIILLVFAVACVTRRRLTNVQTASYKALLEKYLKVIRLCI